jgi:hypothetical protein
MFPQFPSSFFLPSTKCLANDSATKKDVKENESANKDIDKHDQRKQLRPKDLKIQKEGDWQEKMMMYEIETNKTILKEGDWQEKMMMYEIENNKAILKEGD